MRRALGLLAASFTVALSAQPWPPSSDGAPSVTDPSIPLSYVGNDGSVSLGINDKGQSEGQLLGVFARNNTRAVVGQLWWDRTGAGGLQTDFNWLWGMDPIQARNHPDSATVARLSFALDQNADHDRKATLGFGIERRDFSLEAYLARGISGARPVASTFHSDLANVSGADAIGNYTQIETTTVETLYASKPYGTELGFQLSHVFEPFSLRVHGGASSQSGDGARANTFSAGLDSPLGTHGWGISGLAEHVSRHGGVDGSQDDDRVSVFLRYEFGSHGSFVPVDQAEDPAWISRSLGRGSSAHPRNVESHRVQRSQTVAVTRSPKQYTNRFPLLHDDIVTAFDGQPLSIDVLANDSDPDGDPLTLTALTSPSHGTAVIAGARVVYTPTPGFIGADSFRYTAIDGRGGSASALVSITVGGRPNQPPIARNDAATTVFGRPVTIDVLANDSDPDGDALDLLSVGAPANGNSVISGRTVIYTPGASFSGNDRFTYTISDGHGGTATATVVITVSVQPNRPPFARNDSATASFGQLTTIDVLANDTDPDGDALTLVSVTPPAHGTATRSGSQVLYTPIAGYLGADTFTYSIRDGHGGSATATVTITVTALPNRPPVALNDTATTSFTQPVTISVLNNDSDPDGDPLTLVSVTAPSIGTAVISGNQVIYTPTTVGVAGIDRFTYTISDGRGGNATAQVTVNIAPATNRPPVANNDAATTAFGQPVTVAVLANDSDPDGDQLSVASVTQPSNGTAAISGTSVIYTPAAGFSGADRFSYSISDGRGGTATATVDVAVAPVPNQPPVAVNDAAIVSAAAGTATVAVLANDSDPDGDPLTIIGITQPAGGTVSIVGSVVSYKPNAGFLGFDQFTYTISDGRGGTATATVAIFVNG